MIDKIIFIMEHVQVFKGNRSVADYQPKPGSSDDFSGACTRLIQKQIKDKQLIEHQDPELPMSNIFTFRKGDEIFHTCALP